LPSVALSELDASVGPSFAKPPPPPSRSPPVRASAHLEKAAEAHPVADG